MTEIPAFSWQYRSQLILGILQGWVATYIKLQLSSQNMVFSGCPMHSPHLICQSISLKKKKVYSSKIIVLRWNPCASRSKIKNTCLSLGRDTSTSPPPEVFIPNIDERTEMGGLARICGRGPGPQPILQMRNPKGQDYQGPCRIK